MYDKILRRENCIKYLGIFIDSNLNWKSQIDYITKKIKGNIGILSKLGPCAGFFHQGGSQAFMPKKVPIIQRIINNDILKIVNIVFFGGGGSCPLAPPPPPLCTTLI
jgi:hypothetical protein